MGSIARLDSLQSLGQAGQCLSPLRFKFLPHQMLNLGPLLQIAGFKLRALFALQAKPGIAHRRLRFLFDPVAVEGFLARGMILRSSTLIFIQRSALRLKRCRSSDDSPRKWSRPRLKSPLAAGLLCCARPAAPLRASGAHRASSHE